MADLNVVLTPKARTDLEDIWLYTVQTYSMKQADTYLSALDATFQMLAEMPRIARERLEFSPPIRLHPSGQHLVAYRATTDRLEVIRVVHKRRNWGVLFDTD